MPGVFSPCGAPNQIRRPFIRKSCISTSGMPQLTIPLVLETSSKAKGLKFNRTSFNLVAEIAQFHRMVPAGLKGLAMTSRLADEVWSVPGGLVLVDLVMYVLAASVCRLLIIQSTRALYWLPVRGLG